MYSRCVKEPVITPGKTYSATYLGFTVASANSQNSGMSANSVNLWSPISRNRRALRRLHDRAQGVEPLLDEGVFIEIRRGILGFMGQANEIQGPQAVADGKYRPVDRLGPEALSHPGEIDFR